MAGMTPWDTFFVVMAVVEVICVAAMAYVATMFMQTARKGERRVQPLLREVVGLKQLAVAMAQHTQSQATAVIGKVTSVTALVKRRVDTTQKIAREVLPTAQQTATGAKEMQADFSRKAVVLGDLARRLGRVKAAAESAATVAREPQSRDRAGAR